MAFNMAQAVDLSGIAAAAKAPPPPPGASFVLELDEQNFQEALQLSLKHPIVIELYSPRANAQELSDTLIELANAAGGQWLLGRVNVDESAQIAQAFGVQAVPTVIGVVGGQLAPLFQGTRAKAEAQTMIGQLLQAAAAAGISGIADPVSVDETVGPDPRFTDADAALERGDYAAAVAAFDKLLAQNPADLEAKVGRAQADLLLRISSGKPEDMLAAAKADPSNIVAQLAAADVEIAGGQAAAAFARLIDLIRNNAGSERETIRLRLLELFDTQAPGDPAVAKARRDLMAALF